MDQKDAWEPARVPPARFPFVVTSIQVTIDRYGHLMDGLDQQTATRLDAIATTVHRRDTSRDPPGLSR